MTNVATIVVAVLALMGSVFSGVLVYRVSTRANATNDRKVDLDEHRLSIERLEKIIEQQDKYVERIRVQAERVQDQLAKEQDVSQALRQQVRILQNQIDELNRSRARLEETLSAMGRGKSADTTTP